MPASSREMLVPVTLRKEGENHLIIEWNDGHRAVYSWKRLRERCPCANCREERLKPPDPFRILKPDELTPRAPLAASAMPAVGRYGYKIIWNDGHDTGIYTLDDLRALCECPTCLSSAQPRENRP